MYAKTTSMLIFLALPVLVLSGCQSGVDLQSNPTASEATSSLITIPPPTSPIFHSRLEVVTTCC